MTVDIDEVKKHIELYDKTKNWTEEEWQQVCPYCRNTGKVPTLFSQLLFGAEKKYTTCTCQICFWTQPFLWLMSWIPR